MAHPVRGPLPERFGHEQVRFPILVQVGGGESATIGFVSYAHQERDVHLVVAAQVQEEGSGALGRGDGVPSPSCRSSGPGS